MSEFIVIGQRAEDGIAIDFSKPAVGELVRCKDCKNYMTIHCTCDGCCISDDWYCADGKRKEQEHEMAKENDIQNKEKAIL